MPVKVKERGYKVDRKKYITASEGKDLKSKIEDFRKTALQHG